jgi:acetyl esterase/lipase
MSRVLPGLLLLALLMMLTDPALADSPEPVDLWPARPPALPEEAAMRNNIEHQENGRIRVTRVGRPTLTVHAPESSNRSDTAVIVCPGGAYQFLSLDNEGYPVIDWLNDLGLTAVLLKYRVPRAEHVTHWQPPLMDAQRAVSYVRHHAERLQVDPEKIGILGFSAGGHLAALTSTRFDQRAYDPIDAVDAVSPRPSFSVLIYPAYMTVDGQGQQLASELTVTDRTPPAVMFHAADDPFTCLGSARYFEALRAHDINAGLHIFADGGHGFGLGRDNTTSESWPDLAGEWLKAQGYLSAASAVNDDD